MASFWERDLAIKSHLQGAMLELQVGLELMNARSRLFCLCKIDQIFVLPWPGRDCPKPQAQSRNGGTISVIVFLLLSLKLCSNRRKQEQKQRADNHNRHHHRIFNHLCHATKRVSRGSKFWQVAN